MKWRFTVYICGQRLTSKPLTREQLDETIRVHLDNGCTYFDVEAVEE